MDMEDREEKQEVESEDSERDEKEESEEEEIRKEKEEEPNEAQKERALGESGLGLRLKEEPSPVGFREQLLSQLLSKKKPMVPLLISSLLSFTSLSHFIVFFSCFSQSL